MTENTSNHVTVEAQKMMSAANISTDEFEGLEVVDVQAVKNFLKIGHAIPLTSEGAVNYTATKKTNFGGKKVHYDYTGRTVEQVFDAENQLNPSEHFKFLSVPQKEYLNIAGNNKHIMAQLGRALAQLQYGKWEYLPEFDGEEETPGKFVMGRNIGDNPRRIKAFVKPINHPEFGWQHQSQVVQWSFDKNVWYSHDITGLVHRLALAYHRRYNIKGGWLICLTKYHFLGLLLRIKDGLPVGGNQTAVKGISLIKPNTYAIAAMVSAYRSEIYQLSGYDYSDFYDANEVYGRNAVLPRKMTALPAKRPFTYGLDS